MRVSISLEKKGFVFLLKLLCSMGVAFLAWSISSQEAAILVREREEVRYIPLQPRNPSRNKEPKLTALSDKVLLLANGGLLQRKKEEFVAEKKDFIFADLEAMQITFFRSGSPEREFTIRAKGKDGSFFETPNGLYTVQLKEQNHFSSIGEVWMPWSMHFFGNYFIHGWPYYPGGKPVADAFSGGCIRLSNEDAKALYAIAKKETPILVLSPVRSEATASTYFKKVAKQEDRIDRLADSVLVADFETGQVLFEKNSQMPYPLRSLTALMTALVSVEAINRFRYLTVSKDVWEEEDKGNLRVGEKIKSEDLLYPLLLEESIIAAKLYEKEVWRFTDLMNQKAHAIGLINTHFYSADGSGDENNGSAADLFVLLKFVAEHKTPLRRILETRSYTLSTNVQTHTWNHSGWREEDPKFTGGMGGTISGAGGNFVSLYRVRFSEFDDRIIAFIMLGVRDHVGASRETVSYLEENFVYGNVVGKEKEHGPLRSGASVYRIFYGL